MSGVLGLAPGMLAKARAQGMADAKRLLPADITGPRMASLGPTNVGSHRTQFGAQSQLGGAGRDTPQSGKERGVFEKERQGRGTGDKPPIYTPKDDGERGGYVGRTKKMTGGSSMVRGMIL